MKFHPHTAIPTNQPHPAKPYEQREYPDNKPLINMKTIRALLSDIIEIIDTLEMLKAPKFPAPAEYCDPGPCTPQVGTPYVSAHASAEGGPHLEVTEFAKTVAEALEKAQLGEVKNVSGDGIIVHTYSVPASADDAPVWEKARQAVAEAQVNPDYTDAPADDHTITIGFAAQGEPEAEEPAHAGTAETLANALGVPIATVEDGSITHITAPAKTRKPRTPAKLPRPEGVAKAPKPDPVDFDAVRAEVAASISSLVEQGKKENIKELLTKFGADRAREISDENIVAFRDELVLL